MSLSPINGPALRLDALKLDTPEPALQQEAPAASLTDQEVLASDAWGDEPRVFGLDLATPTNVSSAATQGVPSSAELDRLASLVLSHVL